MPVQSSAEGFKRTGDTEIMTTFPSALSAFTHASPVALAAFAAKASAALGTAEIEIDQGNSATITIEIVSDEDYEAAEDWS